MKVFIVLALTLIGTISTLPEVHPPCNSGSLLRSRCVTFSHQKMTHADAAQSCDGGNIFEIRTEAMYDELATFARSSGLKLWIGAKKTAEGDWRWLSDNSEATLGKKWFASGEPNNLGGNEECLQMKPNGKLNDADCGKSFAYVCIHAVTP